MELHHQVDYGSSGPVVCCGRERCSISRAFWSGTVGSLTATKRCHAHSETEWGLGVDWQKETCADLLGQYEGMHAGSTSPPPPSFIIHRHGLGHGVFSNPVEHTG